MCFLRSASPIHVQYLKNMGVSATLVVSLIVGGKLWGLVSCHHYSPRCLPFEIRSVCELLGEAIGTRIAALESFARGQCELAARRLEQSMVESLSREGDWRGALFDGARSLLLPLNASGAALVFEGQIQTIGEAPGTEQIRALAGWVRPKFRRWFLCDQRARCGGAGVRKLTGVAAGLAAAQVSGDGGELLLWFRPERIQTITWGGNPFKSPSDDDDPSELSPRRSFAQWHQVVEGTSDPWTPTDIDTARMIGASVTDVITQFRAVQIVVAKDQLDRVSRRVNAAEQLVIVADAEGRILESNPAFESLLGVRSGALLGLDDLPNYFEDGDEFAARLKALQTGRRSWRGDLSLRTGATPGAALNVRADAVAAADDRALGFVVIFTEISELRAAEAARRRFQESMLQSHRRLSARLETRADPATQSLMSSVVENAQLAALEVTDSADPVNMLPLLEGIRSSVERSAEVLERLTMGSHSPPSALAGRKP